MPPSVPVQEVVTAKAQPNPIPAYPELNPITASAPSTEKPLEEIKGPSGPSETDLIVQKIKAAREAEKNKPKEAQLPPPDSLPSLGGGKGGLGGLPSLGGVGMRKGAFDLDPEYLKRA